jgi:hypothetical protein
MSEITKPKNNSKSESESDSENEIDSTVCSDTKSNYNLNINEDTATMNKQLKNESDKLNYDLANADPDITNRPTKVIKIDKKLLKTLIIEWLSLDDQIKSYRDTIKEITEEKNQFESQILELMGELKQQTILTDKGNIIRNVKEAKGPLTPDLIKSTLSELLKCADTASTYTNHIMEKRQTKEKVNLKRERIGNKNKKNPTVPGQKITRPKTSKTNKKADLEDPLDV